MTPFASSDVGDNGGAGLHGHGRFGFIETDVGDREHLRSRRHAAQREAAFAVGHRGEGGADDVHFGVFEIKAGRGVGDAAGDDAGRFGGERDGRSQQSEQEAAGGQRPGAEEEFREG